MTHHQSTTEDPDFLSLEKNIKKIIISESKADENPLKSSQFTIKLQSQSDSQIPPEVFDFVTFRNFATEKSLTLTSPRSSHVTFTRDDIYDILQYDGMKEWFRRNVATFMKQKERWPRHVYPERLLYIYGPRGMGRLTQMLLLCHEMNVNLMFVPSSILLTTYFMPIFKKAREIQPCLIYFDDADSIFNFKPFLDVVYSVSNSVLNKRDDNVWMVFATNVAPDSLEPMAKSMITDYGSITDVNAIESSEQAKSLIMQMLSTMTRMDDYPCTTEELGDRYSRWHNIINLFSMYTRYCTIKELEMFLIQLFRSYLQDFKHRSESQMFPTYDAFEIAMNDAPALDDRSDLRTLTATRDTVKDYKDHENQWSLYIATSGIKSVTRTTPSSPEIHNPRPYPLPHQQHFPNYQPSSAPASSQNISREEQREMERRRRHDLRMQAETENIFRESCDFSDLPLPPPTKTPLTFSSQPSTPVRSPSYYSISSPSHSVFEDEKHVIDSSTEPLPRPTTTPLPTSSTHSPPPSQIIKKRPSTPVITSSSKKPESEIPSISFWKRLRKN
jgi:hypothetical protein